MNTHICPTCGCSLIRLGITSKNSVTREYKNKTYHFCCDGCAAMFDKTPEALLNDTKDLVVCPSCLAEKSTAQTITIKHEGSTIHLCKCPYCKTVFQEDPEYYLKRLSGEIKYSGVFSEGRGCCA